MILKKLSKMLIVTGLIIGMPLNIAFAEETMDLSSEEESLQINQSIENDKIEDIILTENTEYVIDYDSNSIVLSDIAEQEDESLQSERATTVIWSETVSANGIAGITKYLTPTWNSNQTARITFNITNGGNTPVLFSVIDGIYGGTITDVIIPVSGSKSLTINGSDIPKTISQGVYYANITVRAVNANYESDTISFYVSANLIK